MELVLLIGIQATGKSSFYLERFFNTHVRVNLDMLKTHERERLLVEACLKGRTPFVVDKMNLTREQRARYIGPAHAAGFKVQGYFFPSPLEDALWRNRRRDPAQQVPDEAICGAGRRLEPPRKAEGFDELLVVRMDGKGGFTVEEWRAEL
jgi:predicted kinase